MSSSSSTSVASVSTRTAMLFQHSSTAVRRSSAIETSTRIMLSAKGGAHTHTTTSTSTTTSTTTMSSSSSSESLKTDGPPPVGVQKLYLLLPNHKCPNKKTCPFHPPEQEEEELESAEMQLVNKRRALSLTSNEDKLMSDQLLAEKLAKINQQISSSLVDGNKLHLPRKTSHDITMPAADLERLNTSMEHTETVHLPSSTREESVASDYESTMTLDSGVMFDSCSDREDNQEEESLPLIQEEVVVPDVVLPAELELKNGEKVPEDDRHRTTFKDGEATLQITELSTVDGGTYTCQAVNDLGEAETSATVTVEEVRHRRKRLEEEEATIRLPRPVHEYDTTLEDTNIAPEFTLPLVDQSRAVGDEVTFTVTVTCRPEPDVVWYHGNQKMTRSSRVSFHHDKGVYRMIILDLGVKDAGEYKCQAINAYGEAWCDCDLKVIEHIPEGHVKPRFMKELEYMTVTQGSLVGLECAVIGDPKPSLKWFKDRRRIDSDAHYKIRSYEDGTVTLVIEGAEVEDSGCYMCLAENDAGSVSTEAKIRVQKVYDERKEAPISTPDRRKPEPEVKKYKMQVPPDFTAKLKNKIVPEGTTVRLNCSVTGIPEPTIRWFRDDMEIFDGHDYTMRNNYGLLSLEIVYAKQSLAGRYKVEASNSEGTVSCSCKLEVEGEEELVSMELDFLRPKFLTKIEDIYVKEGEDATFTCTATGKPMPAFKWQRDMIDVTASKRVETEYDNQGHAHLTLRKVKPTDGGLYYCVAHSRSGRSKCSAYLHVKVKSPSPREAVEYVKPRAREVTSVERGGGLGSPPSLALMLPKTLDVVVGERLKLDCSVQGYPTPLVTWHKGDRELMYSQRHRIILCGTLHTMEIPQVMALDKGEYIVRATNTFGTVETSCYVNILPQGSKVTTPPDYRREAMREAAKMNTQAPFFIKHLPKTIDVMQGIDVRLDCILRRGIELVRWSSSRSSSEETEKIKKELADEGFHGEFIPMEPKSGEKSSSRDKEEKKSDQESRLEHPSFPTTPSDLVCPIGSEAVFECTSAGNPEPEIKWYKDGRVLIASDGVRMTSVGNKHKLKIKAIISSDEGEYVCKAKNLAGTKTCGATLTIVSDSSERRPSKTQHVDEDQKPSSSDRTEEAPPPPPASQEPEQKPEKEEKPSFSETLPKTSSASHGDDVELACRLTSVGNVASVKWEKDGKELPKEARYCVTFDEVTNEHKLTVLSATEKDSAKYTCVVVFKDGDLIHTSTKLDVTAKESKPSEAEEEGDSKPHFTTKLKDTLVRDGEGLVLECDIEGNPRPQISWIRDGVEIFDSQDFQISMIGSHCKLQINDIYPEDEGKYSCKAVNSLGETITTCYVTVEGKTRGKRGEKTEGDASAKKKKSKKEEPEVAPELVVKPRRQFTDDGSNAKFKASFDGSKSTTLFWSKDGNVLSQDEHFKMYEADGFHFLEVLNVAVQDNGIYSVTVQNSAGSDTASAELEVFEKPKLLTRADPEWEEPLQDVTVHENEEGVELTCTCRGLTQPSATWYHNGSEVFSGFHMKVHHTAQTSKLVVKKIRPRDAGVFKCVMTGGNGELETSCTMTVKPPEKMEPPVFVKELHDMEVEEGDKLELDVEVKEVEHPEPPDFVTRPLTPTAQEGETATFTCRVKGQPTPSVMWERGGVVIAPNQKYKITRIQDLHTLKVLQTDQTDAGEYICHLHNTVGDASYSCHLNVVEESPSRKSEAVSVLKSRLSRLQGLQSASPSRQEGVDRVGKSAASPESSRRFREPRERNLGDTDEYAATVSRKELPEALTHRSEVKTTTGAFNLHSAPVNISLVKTTVAALNSNPATESSAAAVEKFSPATQNYQDPERHRNMNTGGKGVVRITVRSKDNSPRSHYEIQQKAPETNSRLVISQSQVKHEVKDVRTVIPQGDLKVVDFRSVLKHRQTDQDPAVKLDAPKTKEIDFREVLSKSKSTDEPENKVEIVVNKGGLVGSELRNLQIARTSRNVLSRSGEFVPSVASSVSYSESPSSTAAAAHQNGSQTDRGFAYRRSGPKVNVIGLKSVNKTLGALDVPSVSISLESPQSARQSYRRSRQDPKYSPSSSLNLEDGSNVGDTSISGNTVQKVPYVVTVNKPLAGSNASVHSAEHSNNSLVEEGNSDVLMPKQLEDESHGSKDASNSFKSEIVVHETRSPSRGIATSNMYPPTERPFSITISSPTAATHIRPVSGRISMKDVKVIQLQEESQFSVETENIPSAKETQGPLSAGGSLQRASYVELKPEASTTSTSVLAKPVMTSVSVTLPSSSLSPSLPKSVSSGHDLASDLSTGEANVKQEENDEVFTEGTEILRSPQHKRESPRTNKRTSNEMSYGPMFTWEKSPWIDSDGKLDDDLARKFSTSEGTWDKNVRDRVMRNSRARYSEHLSKSEYQDENTSVPIHEGASSNAARSSSLSSTSTPEPHSNVSSSHDPVDDFRSVKLKPARTAESKRSDLSKSKYMSKSTESIFADIKLKPVPKTDDSLKKSNISNNPASIRAKSKSSDFSEFPGSFSQWSSPRTKSGAYTSRDETALSSSKVSNRRRTFQDDRSTDANRKPATHYAAEHRAVTSTALKTNASSATLPRKSKGIGAKFEAAIKDTKDSSGYKSNTLPRTNYKKDQNSLTNQGNSRVYKTGGISEKVRQWKAADVESVGKPLKKTLGVIGKSQSNNALLNSSGGASNMDKVPEWVKVKAANKRYSLQMEKSPALPRERRLAPREDAPKTPRVLKRDKENLDDSRLNKTEGFQDKRNLFEEKNTENRARGEISDSRNSNIEPRDGTQDLSMNKPSSSAVSTNKANCEQSTVPEWLNRTPVKNIEEKIKSKARPKPEKEDLTPEWVKAKSPRDIKHKEITSKFEFETKFSRNAHKEQQSAASTGKSTTVQKSDSSEKPEKTLVSRSSEVQHISTSKRGMLDTSDKVTEQVVSEDDQSFAANADAEKSKPKDVVTTPASVVTATSSSSVSVPVTTSVTTFVPTTATVTSAPATEVSHSVCHTDPKPAVSVIPASPSPASSQSPISADTKVISDSGTGSPVSGEDNDDISGYTRPSVRKSGSLDTSSSRQAPKETQQHNQQPPLKGTGVRPSWMKQKSLRHIPIYPIHDNELSPRFEPFRASVDDSESVVSTASISSSSSDASTVTNDSGYPRSNTRELVDEVNLHSAADTTSQETTKGSPRIPKEQQDDDRLQSQTVSSTSEDLDSSVEALDIDQNNVPNSAISSDDKGNTKGHLKKLKETHEDETSRASSEQRDSQILRKETTDEDKSYTRDQASRLRGRDESSPLAFADKPSSNSASLRDNQAERPRDSRFSNDSGYLSTSSRRNKERDTDGGSTKKFGKSEAEQKKTREEKSDSRGIAEPKVNGASQDSEHEEPRSKFGRRLKENGSALDSEGGESSKKFGLRSKEKVAYLSSDPKDSDSEFNRLKAKFGRRLKEENESSSSSGVDESSRGQRASSRPSGLDLDPSWRSSRSRLKVTTAATELSKEEDNTGALHASAAENATTATSAAPEQPAAPQQCPPSFLSPLCDTSTLYGSRAVLQCQVAGNPKPGVRWLLNQTSVETSEGIELSYTDDTAQLTVLEIFPEHEGDYTCTATNTLGTASTHCRLSLEASNKTEGRAFEGPVSFPPRIVSLTPKVVSLARDSTLNLTVTFVGEPAPTVKWILAGKELTSDGRTKIVTEKNTSCLTIESVNQSDAGKMSVCLTSSIGTDQASANICIEDVPGAPVGMPHVYDIGRNSASLSWCGPASSGGSQVTYYSIEAKTRHQKTWDVIVPQCKELSYHILDLKPATTYQFRVRAANKHGLGAPSEASERVITSDPLRSPSDYDSEDDLPFEPKEVKINTKEKFEDHYTLEKEVGKGKFGVVYKCRQKKDDTVWAAKIVKCREKDKDVLRQEVDIMNKLRHPKLLLLWDAYESPRQMVLVMEYVGAGELFERVIGEDFVLTERDCTHFLRQICEGVAYMHERSILHLDLKPENILCIAENSNRVKIIDFGLARVYNPEEKTKVLFGTPEFIAPEVINYEEIGFATDMWSVGVICYVLLSGLSPFLGDSDAETLASVTSGEFDFDDEAFDEISDQAKDFISKLLVKKKEDRMLTDHCLAHDWLNQDDVDGMRYKRLNTERLKRFMVRRKWLKTGNAVLAVSRLLKSSSLTSFGSLSRSNSNDSMLSTPSPTTTPRSPGLALHRTSEEEDEDEEEVESQSDPDINVKNKSGLSPSQNLASLQDDGSNTVTNNIIKDKYGFANQTTDQNDNQLCNRNLEVPAKSESDCANQNVAKTTSTAVLAGSAQLDKSSQKLSPSSLSSSPPQPPSSSSHTTSAAQSPSQSKLISGNSSNLQAPVFTKSMKHCEACAGDVARFDVIISGEPAPQVTWFFEDEEVHADSRHTMDSNERTKSYSLIIRSIEEDDEGEYTCKAVNSQGEITCAAELSVLEI